MPFDPVRKRWAFSDEGGGLRRCLSFPEIDGKPVGNYAVHDLESIGYAWLVGLQTQIAPVLPRALDWLNAAIERDEDFGQDRNFHRSTLRSARAMSMWMYSTTNASEDWAEAARCKALYWSSEQPPMTPAKIIGVGSLDDYMAYTLQAGQYADGITAYDRLVGVPLLKLPKRPKPREIAYAFCLHQERGLFDEFELFEAGRRMLQARLEDDWLGRGQSQCAAMWLKIVYWDRDRLAGRTPTLTPLQTILKAYDNMPNVPVPDFIRPLLAASDGAHR